MDRFKIRWRAPSLRPMSSVGISVIAISIIATLPAVFINIYSSFKVIDDAKHHTIELSNLYLDQSAHRMEFIIDRIRETLEAVGSSFVIIGQNVQCTPEFESVLTPDPSIAALILVRSNGEMICSNLEFAAGASVSDREYFQRVQAERRFTVGNVVQGRLSGESVLVAALPLFDDAGVFRAAVVTGIKADWLRASFGMESNKARDYAYRYIGPDDRFTFDLQPDPAHSRSDAEHPVRAAIGDQGEFGFVEASFGLSSVERDARRLATVSGLIGLAALALSLTFAFVLEAHVGRPLRRLTQSVRRVHEGDLHARYDGSPRVHELRDLADDFNGMAAALEESQEHDRQRLKRLTQVNDELRAFSYIASHDLKEPLRAVTGFGDLLAEHTKGALDTKGKRYLKRMIEGATRMAELIDGLGAYVRAGQNTADFVPLSVAAENARKANRSKLRDARGKIIINQLPELSVPDLQFTQIFENIFSNSIKFRSDARRLEISVTGYADDENCFISISDNGVGFDPNQSDRIFQIFQRVHSDELIDGTGVGLAIVKKLIESRGGEVEAFSAVGEGVRIELRIPTDPSIWS